jgi:CDP-diacylglycerol---serine O-phosphatidyltransferase
MKRLANILTSFSLLCGFSSIVFSLERHFTFAAWAIILAVVFDGLDGQVARMSLEPNEFGKEFDSLVDVISFGIAPSVLGYIFIYGAFSFWATLALFVYLFCSVARLAKYNITPHNKLANYFYGVPTTVSGGMLASFILIFRNKECVSLPGPVPFIFVSLVFVLAFLMVSRVRYLNLDSLKRMVGKRLGLVLPVLAVLLLLAAFLRRMGISVFTLFLIYLIFSPFVVKRINSR